MQMVIVFLFVLPALAQEAWNLRELPSSRVTVAQGGYFPRLLAVPGGDLLAFFKTGAAHIGKGGRVSMSRSSDGGATWSQAATIFDRPDADDGVTAIGLGRSGMAMIASVSYSWTSERYSYEGWTADTWFLSSKDRGRSWSEPVKVNVKPLDWAYPFGHILELADGTLLLSGYGGGLPMTREGEQTVFVVRSRDGGRTWGDLSTMARGYNEVCMIPKKDKSLLAVMRSVEGAHLARTESRDAGRTWSKPVRITEDREHPGDLLRLSTGELLLTFGQRNKPFGVQAMISRDDGVTWDRANRWLLAWDGDHSDIGYPVTVELSGGRMVTIYYVVYGERDSEGLKGIAPKNAFTKAVLWKR